MKQLQYLWKNSILKIFNQKMGLFAVLMLITSRTYAAPLRQYSVDMDYPCSWCIFPFVMSSFSYLILFWFAVIYVNSDVPFMQHVNMYHAIRMGRRRWALGQIGGIFVRSFVMVVLSAVSTILPLLPDIEWTNEWGSLLRTAAWTNALNQYQGSVTVYYEIFSEFSPLSLMALEIFICTMLCTMMGVLMFALSLFFNKICAVAGSIALAIAMFFVVSVPVQLRYKLAFLIPTVWAELARIATPSLGYYWLPSLTYMVVFLILTILGMSIFILVKVRQIEFDWENEDI